ncbi:chemotaxis protein CheB [Flavitalea sp. BT771]|uniref:chemotaxis protein CheB n=1 Tax=Flavitalea sp. BT771 TaxID=3063329 RepID=UPI0026E48D96|nr:chemotaxis protein CheB [Flavitalea sp. BT771]MDO6428981.1 chemotaxis protein CheB [Flavitalea sp. BT771]MDV6218891.1 chemotaxis protein CheB [Flavitalea sp. BT771]
MTKSNKDKVKILSSNLFPVVGIGASAGGLEAFKKLLKAIPEDSGMAYILVQHLDPAHESILADLLQRVTKIPVQEITDNIHVVPDHIYIIPSNKLLTATDGVLQLSARLPKGHRNLPIDVFFTSLAEVHQSHAIGVVLSGTATDGTLGLKAIKDHGGITFAQEQQSAGYDGMPQSAIDAGVVDFILPPEKIPGQLLLLNDSFKANPIGTDGNAEQAQENGFKQIITLLRIRRGVDFTYYKQTTIRRRINRRIALSMKGSIAEYLAFLQENTAEQDILYQDLLIPVTQFFRDPKIFESLSETVFPALLKDRKENEPLRIWIAGCSTGEEAYSMVMCFQEYVTVNASNLKMQLFATDISETAISKARSGIYTSKEMNGLSADRVQQFFTRTDGNFRLNKTIRDACVFARHNYLKDPPFAKIDLISCRNSLIYLEPFLQKKALTTFHYSLKESGFLVLGKSETSGQAAELYNDFDKTNKFYTRKAVKGNFLHVLADRNNGTFKAGDSMVFKSDGNKNDYQKSGDEVLLSKYVPPGVIVNEEMEIVQFRGATGMWLEPSPGKPSSHLLKMAREGLAFELRNALHKAKKSKEEVVKENIPLQFAGREHLVTIEVIPLPETIEPYFLVLFRDTSAPGDSTGEPKTGNKDLGTPDAKLDKAITRNKLLQRELAQTREDMRSVTEDQEAANEELQSANEELLSGSEELQSLNEELETSKEEVQTSNEELIIVNQELFDRNEQLNLSRLYAESIVTTISEPLIILNKELKVRSANRAFYEKFQVKEEDTEGKLLFELGKKQWNKPELKKKLEKVLPQGGSIVDYEVAANFPILGERIMLLNAIQIVRDPSEQQSILIAIEDVTDRWKKNKEDKALAAEMEKKVLERTFSLHEANSELQHSNENLAQFAYIASHDLQEPLRKIRTFSTTLQDKYFTELPDPVKILVTKINASAERMSSLIKELLNFSQLLNSDAAFEHTDLDQILSHVIADFDLLIAEKGVVIKRQPLPVIDAIPLQMNQLFYNLLSNAIKFSRQGIAPVITITSKILKIGEAAKYASLNPQFSYCEIAIKDNGIGFKQKMEEQIFLVFHRLHSQEKYKGTGIGLALCKKIIDNHHGEISAKAKENEGSIFKIVLPLSR